jgi:predicted aspartyl protease
MSTTIDIRTAETQPFILLPVVVNGKGPFQFVVDTGAGIPIVTEELAKTLALEHTEVKEALGTGGKKFEMLVGMAGSITVGEAKVANAKVGVMKTLPRCIGKGVIGYDFLRHFVVTIDYGRNTFTLLTPEEYKHNPALAGAFMPLRLARPDRPIILLDVRVDDRNTYQFILDTGASQTVVSPALAEQMSVESTGASTIIGASGAVTSSFGILRSLRIGSTSMENVPVAISDAFSPLSQAVATVVDGILGYNVLRAFRLTIDYPSGKLQFLSSRQDETDTKNRS